jgi:tRNA 2-selenouridine synthase
MVQIPQPLCQFFAADAPRFDAVIDVRSPAEYADDHAPGAVNLPVLSDAERARVGTIYKQVSPFEARKVGAALVSRNIARHLDEHFADKPKDYRPLLYCWRGGQRSGSFALVLSQIGFRVTVLQGGYKTYRGEVMDGLRERPAAFRYRILAGATGSGKTLVLRAIAAAGGQVLDLEALANHRGSLLGAEPDSPQPAQRLFESRLYHRLRQLDPARPAWVEAESNRIGDLQVPVELWRLLKAAGGVELKVPPAERTHHLLRHYRHFTEQPDRLKELLRRLRHKLGGPTVEAWCADVDAGQWERFVANVLEQHYDPAYTRSFRQNYPHVTDAVDLPDTGDAAVLELAGRLASEPELIPVEVLSRAEQFAGT